MNKHILFAAFARNPEIRYTPSGTAVFEGVLAGERIVTGADGKTRSIPFYTRVQALGKYAEQLNERHYQQGSVVVADGQLDYSQWSDPEGGKRSLIRTRLTGSVREAAGEYELVQDASGGVRLKGGHNQVTLMGNVARDPDLRYTPAGDAVLNISIGVNESWKDKNGQKQEKTHWIDLTLWRDLAEQHKNLRKGDAVMVEGSTVDDSFTDKDGNKRSTTKVEVSLLIPLKGRATQAAATPAPAAPPRATAPARPAAAPSTSDLDDLGNEDIPF